MDIEVREALEKEIIKVLGSDSRPMTFNFLMNKVFKSFQSIYPHIHINHKEFSSILSDLHKKFWVGRTKNNKYYLDYLDYEETGVEGEGYLEVDLFSGHGYITLKRNYREYKKPSYFVHKKNINGAKWGDYVAFRELNNTKKQIFALKDATVKKILPKPKIQM